MMVEQLETISESLIKSHMHARNHLLNILSDVNLEQWETVPKNSLWSIQSTCAEILNYEVETLNKTFPGALTKVADNFSLQEFRIIQNEISEFLSLKLREENLQAGFTYTATDDGPPTVHWIMVRTIQHSIYHSGGISVLRHFVGLPRAEYAAWEQMVDSVFLAGFGNLEL
ncbi:MAG: hypothetical protein IH840_01480 [Candidatus Heimdallarchaeota archaeon]|nr:hypothetical protein [Candidatus Heimdallarchaeota archaeon]